ncbi:AAA domain-containing protein [Methylobacterium brachiatum]
MACRVRYLRSAGIHRREIPGIEALSEAFPEAWLLYASLQCFQRYEEPFDVDAMVVMDDRVLLLEIKDWNGTIVANGDSWLVNGKSRRSPIAAVGEKARKLGTFLRSRIVGFGQTRVDPRVVLTGTAGKPDLRPEEGRLLWSLDEAVSIVQPGNRTKLLETATLQLNKPYQLEVDFERVTGNGRMFGPSERNWDGFKVVEEDYVRHPNGIWREHRAELGRDARRKALLRIWAFDRLPPSFNSTSQRRLVADREAQVFGHLAARNPDLSRQGRILRPIGEDKDDILTEHYELRELPAGWTTLDRWLERARDSLDDDDRRNAVASLLNLVAELHDYDVEHRDLGPRSVWIESPTQLALSGFMSARVPGDPPLGELHRVLGGYARHLPPEPIEDVEGSGKRRDVFCLGHLASEIMFGRPASPSASIQAPPSASGTFPDWLAVATAALPQERYPDARVMADVFGTMVDETSAGGIDRSLFDRFETTDIPYAVWAQDHVLSPDPRHLVYVSKEADGAKRVVKIWPRARPGEDAGLDIALSRLCDAAGRLETSPIRGLPTLKRVGISPIGTFVVETFADGTSLGAGPVLDAAGALMASETLISTVEALHAMGFWHGRMEPARILVDRENGIHLLGTFDLPAGSASAATSGNRTAEAPHSSAEQRDRRAVISACLALAAAAGEPRFAELIGSLQKELDRPVIELLEPSALAIRKAAAVVRRSDRVHFELFDKDAGPDFFRSDNGSYYLRVRRPRSNMLEYSLAGVDRELIFEVVDGQLSDARTDKATFKNLSHASQHGVPVEIDVVFVRGESGGLEELFSHLEPLIAVPDAAIGADNHREAAPTHHFDVQRFWRRHLELEEEAQPEVEILRRVGPSSGPTAFYGYERIGRDWDTDTDARIEVIGANGRKNGEVDLSQTDARTLAIRFSRKVLGPGDRVSLVEQGSRTSFDRRTRAIERILDDEAAIDDLIDYFSPQRDAQVVDYGIDVDDASLEAYGLNPGQKAAFSHMSRFGPLGLLQGPPGTGKTRFIAAFVHWLVTVRGARRILITSQSHEAVNNVIETLVDLFRKIGKRPSLLRIGSKGITDKIRPYHVDAIRERYRTRFDAAFKHRVQGLCGSMGIGRALVAEAVEIDRRLGAPARHLALVAKADATTRGGKRGRRRATAFARTAAAFRKAGLEMLGREVDPEIAAVEIDRAYDHLLDRHPGTSPSDIRKVRAAIALSHEWSGSLATAHRNFEEFLGKTREIVTATCVGAGQTKIRLDAGQFDWVVIDEAARCTAGELAVPIQAGRRVLLVGDHRQLLPMVQREVMKALQKEMPEVSQADLVRSDFERSFLSSYGRANGVTLTEQYRMDPAICRLISETFYEPYGVTLRTSDDREHNPLFDANPPHFIARPITWVDTTGLPGSAERRPDWSDTTFWNEAEIDAVMEILNRISETTHLLSGLAAESAETPIGVICMYSAQKLMIEQAFSQRPWDPVFRRLVRIDTVDSYQGKENTIVIVSLVRNNPRRDPGHVRIPNRCNVAFSRAKERLFIVGAREMWAAQKAGEPMERTIRHIDDNGDDAATLKAGRI